MAKNTAPMTPNEVDDQVSPHGEPNPQGKGKAKGAQTNQPFEQEPERRAGHYTGAGEPGRKQPGGRH
jgi:hypothetical protein